MANIETTAHVRPKIAGRALSVFGVTFSFLAMLVSGAVLYFAPKGKVSNDIDWQVLGLDRQGWDGVHIVLATLFVGFSLWHIALHLRTGPVTELFRSFDLVFCHKGETSWHSNQPQSSAQRQCV